MPSLRLFQRRWHIASDILPALGFIFAVFYSAWCIAFTFGSATLENTGLKYDCNQKNVLRAANYSLLALFVITAIVNWCIVGVGLRGGPLEPEKRRAMQPLLYIEIALWVCLLIFTVYGTYVVASPTIGSTCWEQNPCVTSQGVTITNQCKLENGSSVPTLSDPCQKMLRNFGAFTGCWSDWIELGYSWNATGRNWTEPSDCRVLPQISTVFEDQDTNGDGKEDVNVTISHGSGDSVNDATSSETRIPANFTAEVQAEVLRELNLTYTPGNVSRSAPWWYCFNASCEELLSASDECDQWDAFWNISIPDTTTQKAFYEGLIYSSWGMLAIIILLTYLIFNSFPDYSALESWEGTVKGLASTCCCGAQLKAAANSTGDPASREIAKSLYMLFGGIDLDPSDRLLGMFLVAEQQGRRRQGHVLRALEAAGIVKQRGHPNIARRLWRRLVLAVGLRPRSSRSSAAAAAGCLPATHTAAPAEPTPGEVSGKEGLDLQPSAASLAAASDTAGRRSFLQQHPAAASASPIITSRGKQAPASPLKSPFDQQASLDLAWGTHTGSSLRPSSTAGLSHATSPSQPPRALLPMYRHSMVRLRTENMAAEAAAVAGGRCSSIPEDSQQQQQEQQQQGWELRCSPSVLTEPGAGDSTAASLGRQQANNGLGIRLGQRYHPMLTPSGCARMLPITPQEAAGIYTGFHERVPQGVMQEAQRISKFAIGAYGLQSIIWGKGKRPAMCMGNLNMLVRCLGKPLRIESKFRKRNFNAIIDVVGVPPSDLLYVSYANAPGGVLPYMIMLHRPSKSVVLAVRGTVSMEDLVTDLVSAPLEVDSWMPDWVREANTSGERLYAHAGIVGSATAVLKDMDERGLLRELLYSQLVRSGSMRASDRPSPAGAHSGRSSAGSSVLQAMKEMGARLAFWQQQGQQGAEEAESGRSNGEGEGESEAGDEEAGAPAPPDLSRLGAGAEVRLPVGRARTVIRRKLQSEGWQVVVTGHSLGAAVACMLAFHLKDWFPDLRCWAFNPPGGLLSWNLSLLAQRFCTSTVVGKDVISRLSFGNAKRLVDEMVTCLARCKQPKLVVLADILLKRRRWGLGAAPTLCGYEEISDEAVRALEGYHKTSILHTREQVDMYPPGRLIFLRPFKGRTPQQTVWDAVWVDAPALMGEGILVSPAMMAHHRVFLLTEALRSVMAGEGAQAGQGMAEDEAAAVGATAGASSAGGGGSGGSLAGGPPV